MDPNLCVEFPKEIPRLDVFAVMQNLRYYGKNLLTENEFFNCRHRGLLQIQKMLLELHTKCDKITQNVLIYSFSAFCKKQVIKQRVHNGNFRKNHNKD